MEQRALYGRSCLCVQINNSRILICRESSTKIILNLCMEVSDFFGEGGEGEWLFVPVYDRLVHYQECSANGLAVYGWYLQTFCGPLRWKNGALFLSLHDNLRLYRAHLGDYLLCEEIILRKDLLACSPDMNLQICKTLYFFRFEHVWDMLGSRIASHTSHPETI